MSENAWAILPAAGSGERFSKSENKLLAPLGGLPVIVRTLKAVLSADKIDGAVVTTAAHSCDDFRDLFDRYELEKPVLVTPGGNSRRESVFAGLQELPPNIKLVAIHDAARPLVNPEKLDDCIQQLQLEKSRLVGVIMAIPVHDTIKRSRDIADMPQIEKTLDRSNLWRAQTPQVFWRDPLTQAHLSVHPELTITDDAQLIEIAEAGAISLLIGEARNIKITTRDDLFLAEAFLRQF